MAMATLKCNSCGGEISSNARRVQCPHCAALFPFACAECGRNLRPPFAESPDERYLTGETPPRPLCDEHYLRKCPDCNEWFGADENPGYFRCVACAQRRQNEPQPDEAEWEDEESGIAQDIVEMPVANAPVSAPVKAGGGCMSIVMMMCAGCALVGWLLCAGFVNHLTP